MADQLMVGKVNNLREAFTRFHKDVCEVFCTDEVIYDLMRLRGYKTEAMFNTLKEVGVFRAESMSDINLFVKGYSIKQLQDFGIMTKDGDYLLANRYVVPIKDIAGNVIAMVGWDEFGGAKKYVTTPTFGFSRDASFFNFDSYRLSYEQFGGKTFLVEGIFDTLSLKSLGLPVIATMGLELSAIKRKMLNRYTKVIAFHDGDRAGMGVNPYLNQLSGKPKNLVWDIETDHVFVKVLDKTTVHDSEKIKDSDDLVREYDAYGDLLEAMDAYKVYSIVLED